MSVKDAYAICSGGEQPVCGRCLVEIRDMIRLHEDNDTQKAPCQVVAPPAH